jgi:hypothetical protein
MLQGRIMLAIALTLASSGTGCRREAAQGQTAAASTCAPGPGACVAAAPAAAPTTRPARAARLVFVDLEKSCPCTQRRVASSWKALTAVLGRPPSIPLDRFHLDTQAAQADPYVDRRPIMVAPGLYVLDGSGNIIDLLQGEITEAQIRGAIR